MVERLVILADDAAHDELRPRPAALRGRVVQSYGTRVWIVEIPEDEDAADDDAIRAWPGVMDVFDGAAPPDIVGDDETGRLGIAAWNLRQSAAFRATRAERRYDGRSWGDEGVEPEG